MTQPIFISWTGIHVPKLDEILRYDAERFPLIPQQGNCIGRIVVHWVVRVCAPQQNIGVKQISH
ncbi:hypothetical protein [Nostoc sp. MG11]|uniref:hypothetical protein n=1 Tax=Nostoc sp. MG11 TaxID=2721166 RepID=UPI00186715A6|nr:hypothetical protein [Nostoc sp. MG11]